MRKRVCLRRHTLSWCGRSWFSSACLQQNRRRTHGRGSMRTYQYSCTGWALPNVCLLSSSSVFFLLILCGVGDTPHCLWILSSRYYLLVHYKLFPVSHHTNSMLTSVLFYHPLIFHALFSSYQSLLTLCLPHVPCTVLPLPYFHLFLRAILHHISLYHSNLSHC